MVGNIGRQRILALEFLDVRVTGEHYSFIVHRFQTRHYDTVVEARDEEQCKDAITDTPTTIAFRRR
jgi:hypothetical protein